MSRGFAGALLPSHNQQTLDPIYWRNSTLQVVPIAELETYFLTLTRGVTGHRSILAEHPNGHSVHELAVRMVQTWNGASALRLLDQRKYIEDCGGMTRPLTMFAYWLSDEGKAEL